MAADFALPRSVTAVRGVPRPPMRQPESKMDQDVLGSLYLGRTALRLTAANRLRTKDSQLLRRLDAAFASDVRPRSSF